MALSLKSKAACGVARSSRSRVVSVSCHKGEAPKVQIAAAAALAAALFASPVHAGVVLQQPALKKAFQDDTPVAAPVERALRLPGSAAPAPAAKKAEAPKPKVQESSSSEGGLDPRVVALPGALAGIAGLALAASKVDDGFNDWITNSGALVRNSGNWAGFEEDLKGGPGTAPVAAGTKKVKAAATKKGKK